MLSALAILAATLLSSGAAPTGSDVSADQLPLALAWDVPETCPDLESERAEIRHRLGQLGPTAIRDQVAAQVEIRTTSAGGYELSLHTQIATTTGERVLSGPDCKQLADAVALVLALLINPTASLAPEPPPPPVSAPPSPPAAPAAGARTPAAVVRPWSAGLELATAVGLLPGVAAGLAGRMVYQRGHWAAMAEVGGFLPKLKDAAAVPGPRASFYRLEAVLAACGSTSPRQRLGAWLCLGGALVRMHGESQGVPNPGEAVATFAEAMAEVSAHLELGERSRLRLSLQGRGLGSHPDFAILGLGSVYRPALANLRAALGLEARF